NRNRRESAIHTQTAPAASNKAARIHHHHGDLGTSGRHHSFDRMTIISRSAALAIASVGWPIPVRTTPGSSPTAAVFGRSFAAWVARGNVPTATVSASRPIPRGRSTPSIATQTGTEGSASFAVWHRMVVLLHDSYRRSLSQSGLSAGGKAK